MADFGSSRFRRHFLFARESRIANLSVHVLSSRYFNSGRSIGRIFLTISIVASCTQQSLSKGAQWFTFSPRDRALLVNHNGHLAPFIYRTNSDQVRDTSTNIAATSRIETCFCWHKIDSPSTIEFPSASRISQVTSMEFGGIRRLMGVSSIDSTNSWSARKSWVSSRDQTSVF